MSQYISTLYPEGQLQIIHGLGTLHRSLYDIVGVLSRCMDVKCK